MGCKLCVQQPRTKQVPKRTKTASHHDQDFKKVLRTQSIKKTKFTDPAFPPEKSSLCPLEQWKPEYDDYEWFRATEIPCLNDADGKLQIFQDGITPNDINQGSLGDCYFLSSLSVLAERPQRIEKLFQVKEVNEEAVYEVCMTKNGRNVKITLDDYIVCKRGHEWQPAFSRAKGNELWVLLLEKAWAKLHGSFDRIVAGNTYITLRDLSGAPAEYLRIKENEDIFERILDADQKNWCIGASISGKEDYESLGLVNGHAYSVIKAALITDADGNEVKLLNIRNPWGRTEWTGDWGDDSELWTPEIREQVGMSDEVIDDGTFWMNIDDFQTYFHSVDIAKVDDDNLFSFGAIDGDKGVHEINVDAQGNYTFAISQIDERTLPEDSGYKYTTAKLNLFKINDPSNLKDVSHVKGVFKAGQRDTYLECLDLEPGSYYLVSEVNFISHEFERSYCVNSYGPSDVVFKDVTRRVSPSVFSDAINQVLADRCVQEAEASERAEGINSYQLQHDGGIIIVYVNESEETTLNETLTFQMSGLVVEGDEGSSEVVIDLPPGERRVVSLKIQGDGNYSFGMGMSYQLIGA